MKNQARMNHLLSITEAMICHRLLDVSMMWREMDEEIAETWDGMGPLAVGGPPHNQVRPTQIPSRKGPSMASIHRVRNPADISDLQSPSDVLWGNPLLSANKI